ncbi:MAG: HAD-IB family phosphatase [Polyangiaceae bacterium]|nr:HAD-IB family phosphatase [Polyangiaceae bacterium]
MEGPRHEGGRARSEVLEGAAALLERIERVARTGGGGAAALAFDADGTLWTGDVGIDLFEAFLEARGARAEAEEALRREAEAHGVAAEGGAHEIARALYDAFNAERYPEDRAFAMMAWAFAGWAEDEVAAFAERVLEARGIDARIRASLRAVIDWARARGVDVVIVSASPRVIVERGVRRLGVAPGRVFAMTPAVRGGRLAPELAEPPTYGDGKVRALARAVPALAAGAGESPILAAFGDSAYDAPMLRAARVPVAVAPSPRLAALAGTIPGLLVLEA